MKLDINYSGQMINGVCKTIPVLVLTFLIFSACNIDKGYEEVSDQNWNLRRAEKSMTDSLINGSTYLSIYSQIYNQTEHKTYNLTATVSMRNTSLKDTLYIDKAAYFNTEGHSIRNYFANTIYVAPMETVEIIIEELDQEGGTGANFLFDWTIKPNSSEPLFEAVMVSSFGQGMSFTTHGKRVK